jgi:hypothetical protein
MGMVVLDRGVQRKSAYFLCLEFDDTGEQVTAPEGEVLNDEVSTGIGVFDARDGGISVLYMVHLSGMVKRDKRDGGVPGRSAMERCSSPNRSNA